MGPIPAHHLDALARDVEALALTRAGARILVGITGAPAAGKSTFAKAMAEHMADAVALPMDGFHLDDSILIARGHRDRKGAPHTFDVEGFAALLARARIATSLIYAPAFDRELEISRAGAIEIPAATRILFVEGNYLLHPRGGWEGIKDALDMCWYLDLPEEVLRTRLEERWAWMAPEERRTKIEENDMPNARLISEGRSRADRIIDAATLS